jgi:hypothetical protein
MTAETYWTCPSWCERGADAGHAVCVAHLGPEYPASVRVTLGQRHTIPWTGYGKRPAPDIDLHCEDRLVRLEIPDAAELVHLLRVLGHGELADAVHAAVELSGAVLTEFAGRQRWEVPT